MPCFSMIHLKRFGNLKWKIIFLVQKLIHPFSLYVLFSQCRSCDNNLEDCFLPISSRSRAHASIIMKKTKGEIPPELHRENKTYQPKRSINNAACCLEIEARGKCQQSDRKCKSLNRVSSCKEKNIFRSALYKNCETCVKKALCSQASALRCINKPNVYR